MANIYLWDKQYDGYLDNPAYVKLAPLAMGYEDDFRMFGRTEIVTTHPQCGMKMLIFDYESGQEECPWCHGDLVYGRYDW